MPEHAPSKNATGLCASHPESKSRKAAFVAKPTVLRQHLELPDGMAEKLQFNELRTASKLVSAPAPDGNDSG
eukprot:CAMPEP_0172766836 /NCGR_PEP_ID=MMETSP1074-20121228/181923_1 /TAXON_ID=2916 /ORGANISM="Ceratium fusus, Strain PA161109" /LENGTH=71 /DNA_ID=CAMNT_0013602017 /DNA_START=980 /DNA_END=1195 /DNA_ORIENTATION=-